MCSIHQQHRKQHEATKPERYQEGPQVNSKGLQPPGSCTGELSKEK